MKWEELKNMIIADISNRNLKEPNRRLKALEKIEIIIRQHYPIYLQDISNIITIEKESFKNQISEIKGCKLNGAENSIINEIYNKLSPNLQQTKSSQKIRYKVCTCPNCYSTLRITEDIWDQKFLLCPQCGNDFSNPIKIEKKLVEIQKTFLVGEMVKDLMKLFFLLLFVGVLLYCICSCQSSNKNNDSSLKNSTSEIDSALFQVVFSSIKQNENSSIKQNENKLIGIWADDFNKNLLWRIRDLGNNQYIIEMGSRGSDKWISRTQLFKIKKGERILYYSSEDEDLEYYQIDNNGNLSVFDNFGYIATYTRIR